MPMIVKTGAGNAAAAVQAVADEEFQAMAIGDVSAFLRLLAPDAAFFPPNETPKSGSAVAGWIGEFLRGYAVEFLQSHHDEVWLADTWAVLRTSFRWRVAPRAGGDAFVRSGNTVRLFGKGDTGAWRLVREIWATYPATQQVARKTMPEGSCLEIQHGEGEDAGRTAASAPGAPEAQAVGKFTRGLGQC
jgi:ketosteroid isomerase-like protein